MVNCSSTHSFIHLFVLGGGGQWGAVVVMVNKAGTDPTACGGPGYTSLGSRDWPWFVLLTSSHSSEVTATVCGVESRGGRALCGRKEKQRVRDGAADLV